MSNPALQFEVAIVGAGPAGLAAACAAAQSGRRVALLEQSPWLGGQIWRALPDKPATAQARKWFDQFHRSGVTLFDRTCVIAAPEPGLLLTDHAGQPQTVRYQRLILCTGARELFLPFPGWTLPGVLGPGGLQALVKTGWPINGQRVVIAGSGPLLLAVARGLSEHGARVALIAEQAPGHRVRRFGLGLWITPAKLWQAVRTRLATRHAPYLFATWPVRADGDQQLRSVTLTNGENTWTEPCDLLACGFGLVPNVELPLALGCHLDAGFVDVDPHQLTSVPGIYCAGEPTGIGGADCALVEGQIAGFAAAGQPARAEALFPRRASCHRFRRALADTFALQPELKSLADESTLVCRCEDVPLGRLREFTNWREAKLQSRCGMGPCQGRVCGPAAQVLLGWGMDSVRPPFSPAPVHSLIRERDQ